MKSEPGWNKSALLQSPLFAPLHAVIAELDEHDFPTLQDCNALLAAHRPAITVQQGFPLRFVAQEYGKLPFEAQYEPRCYLRGEVPTRTDNWHDLLNALVWLAFPGAKAAINTRHYHALTDANSCKNGAGDAAASSRSERRGAGYEYAVRRIRCGRGERRCGINCAAARFQMAGIILAAARAGTAENGVLPQWH